MNYTLNQLLIFKKVAELRSITKAAEHLHLTQPAVSIQLKNFQAQFSVPLFEVVNKRIYITDFGKEIADSAEQIINQINAINYKTTDYQGILTGKLKISVVSTGMYVAPYFVTDFLKVNNHIELVMDVTNREKVIESLKKNEPDFAFVSILPENLKVEKMELLVNKLFLVGNSKTPFKKEIYGKEIFNQLSLLYREKGSGTRYVTEKYFYKNKISVSNKIELTGNEAIKQAVLAGLGYSIMPLIGIKNEIDDKKIKIIPVKGFPIKSIWYLVWLKNKSLSPVAQAFLEFLRVKRSNIVDTYFKGVE
jgi:DNA-binding transcriptional LysR family regulator